MLYRIVPGDRRALLVHEDEELWRNREERRQEVVPEFIEAVGIEESQCLFLVQRQGARLCPYVVILRKSSRWSGNSAPSELLTTNRLGRGASTGSGLEPSRLLCAHAAIEPSTAPFSRAESGESYVAGCGVNASSNAELQQQGE